ncbi:MAG TPA: hypothetical protein VIL35_05440 [Vicinamibacterales bacterium]
MTPKASPAPHVREVLLAFVAWLDRYGETSWDHQSYYAGPIGRRAKALYYRSPRLGTLAVAPMVASEAFLPAARRLFHRPMRFPIADAHYAMGFGYLYESTGEPRFFDRMAHFLDELEASRCPGYADRGWGYPFDWVTRNGTIRAQTPLITSTPYVYEAFTQAIDLRPDTRWIETADSIVRHVCTDIRDFETSPRASTCSYTPFDQGGVVNASAYRAGMLALAAQRTGREALWAIGERNLRFVLEAQNPDGSWPYAVDGERHFVDHFHTCFVMKGLAKVHRVTGDPACGAALERGIEFYLRHLFDEDGLPRPFARAPRLTVYRRELYDCAECINLCLLLRDRFPLLDGVLRRVVSAVLRDWVKPDGSFRSRQLLLGWDNVPMHRWAQSQMFRALALYERTETAGKRDRAHEDVAPCVASVGS